MHHVDPTNPAPSRPQNPSCPAGGTNAPDQGKRGVIVAPPIQNTSPPKPEELTILHRGFDTLALAIKANIPHALFDYLESEKERADKERRDVLVEYNGIKLHLKPHGGTGYRFIASGGPDGATWFFKKPNPKDAWGIRVSFGSHFLAFYGLAAARLHLDGVLDKLGVTFDETDISLSRVDFCVDVLANDFELTPRNFVMHSGTNRRDQMTETDLVAHGKSGRTTSVTIGAPRNRQVIIYNKRDEVSAKGKVHWWGIWNDTLRRAGFAPLDPKDPKTNCVWRVEFRAGKDLLKDRWNIRTWDQFFERFGDLCREAGEVVRYTDPDPMDINRARWPNHPLWEVVCAEMNDNLHDVRSGCDPNPMKEVQKEQHIGLIFRNILGCSLTLAALRGKPFADLPSFFRKIASDLTTETITNAEKTAKQLQNSKDKYVFLSD